MMKDKFDNIARARRMPSSLPVLQMHGSKDKTVPIDQGRALFAALPAARKRFVVLEGTGHNDVPYFDPKRYLSEIAAFLGEGEGGEEEGTEKGT